MANWPIEKCFEELENIVSHLENETTTLEESLRLFELGMKLSQRCSSVLSNIEKKIQIIVETTKGQPALEDFSPDNEADS
ncbi:MAG: exodeoxyribonuclease VII small subunit [bacterium]|nr:exodeoxyribonuclease VII small subunit [Candidatus Sumerlaeota bacterium]